MCDEFTAQDEDAALARKGLSRREFAAIGAAGVLAALVVGDQGAILPADWALFRDTGIAHLVSISGLHVTVFAWVAALVVGAGPGVSGVLMRQTLVRAPSRRQASAPQSDCRPLLRPKRPRRKRRHGRARCG